MLPVYISNLHLYLIVARKPKKGPYITISVVDAFNQNSDPILQSNTAVNSITANNITTLIYYYFTNLQDAPA